MAHHVVRNTWIVVGVVMLSAVWTWAGPLPATAIAGMIGGSVIGANLPERWRRRLTMPKLPVIG